MCACMCVCGRAWVTGCYKDLNMEKRKWSNFFVAPTTTMDIINRDRVRNGTGMLQVQRLASDRKCTFHPIKHAASLSGSSIVRFVRSMSALNLIIVLSSRSIINRRKYTNQERLKINKDNIPIKREKNELGKAIREICKRSQLIYGNSLRSHLMNKKLISGWKTHGGKSLFNYSNFVIAVWNCKL